MSYESLGLCLTIFRNDVEVVRSKERGRHDWNNDEVRKVEMNSRQSLEREYDTLRSIGEGTGDGGEDGGEDGAVGNVIEEPVVEAEGEGFESRVEEGANTIDEPESSAWRLERVCTRSIPCPCPCPGARAGPCPCPCSRA